MNTYSGVTFLSVACVVNLFIDLAVGQTTCLSGYNYPVSCPRPTDPQDRTRCCRDGYLPSCCEERASMVCASNYNRRQSSTNLNPHPSLYAINCPQPGQSDDLRICCFNNGVPSCCSAQVFGAIMGGVFGGLIFIGLILSIVCCVKIKRGDWVCVPVGPNKYTVMSRRKAEAWRANNNAHRVHAQMEPPPPYHNAPPSYNHGGPYINDQAVNLEMQPSTNHYMTPGTDKIQDTSDSGNTVLGKY